MDARSFAVSLGGGGEFSHYEGNVHIQRRGGVGGGFLFRRGAEGVFPASCLMTGTQLAFEFSPQRVLEILKVFLPQIAIKRLGKN